MYIRQVKATELDEILKLINSNVLDPAKISDRVYTSRLESEGFLIGSLSKEELKKMLDQIFLVVATKQKIIGYLRIDEKIDADFKELDLEGFVDWVHTDFKKYYYQLPHFEIGGVLVSKDFGRKNIGASLLYKAMEKLKYRNLKYLFSFVPVAPIRNEPSLKFHLKNGFKIIAKLQPQQLWGMNHYQSVLLMKESEWI
jgi:ribosomal protein S18 acetylase RimI-like enzyme